MGVFLGLYWGYMGILEKWKLLELFLGYRIWFYGDLTDNVPKAIFYLLRGDSMDTALRDDMTPVLADARGEAPSIIP